MTSRNDIRQTMRARRRALTSAQQYRAARRAARRTLILPELKRLKRVALYLPNDGELDPQILFRWLIARGIQCYLPVLHPHRAGQLRFTHFRPGMRMQRNRFGIPEPLHGHKINADALDLALMPLVAFDRHGNRLGMGAGFYDRTLADRRNRPLLIGMAHDAQYYPELPVQGWDVPLDGIVTDRRLRRFGRRLNTVSRSGK